MDESQSSLQDRVAALEKAVAELRAEMSHRPVAKESSAEAEIRRIQQRSKMPPPAHTHQKPEKTPRSLSLPEDPEALLKWAGIGLVVLAVVFLFKYAVDEGWLTPMIRIMLGLALGLILVAIGGLIYAGRARFGQVLQGGGIAAFYVTLFAGYQLLGVIEFGSSFAGMVVVTLAAFGLGLYQKDPPLIVLGLLGGLATPFLLYTGEANIPGLVAYMCLLLTATTVIYLRFGWNSVLYPTVIGGWTVFRIAQMQLPHVGGSYELADHLAVQLAVAFGVLAFWVAPLVREVVRARNPKLVEARGTESALASFLEHILRNAIHQLVVVTPLVAVALTAGVWQLTKVQTGLVSVGAAIVYALVAFSLRAEAVERIRYTHAVMSGVLATLAIVLLIEGNALLVALAAEMALLHILAGRLDDDLLRSGGHALFVILTLWMLTRLVDHPVHGTPVVNISALCDLLVLAVATTAGLSLHADKHRRVYLALAYAGTLAWLLRELSTFSNGQAFVTVAWTLIGVGLLVFGLRRRIEMLRGGGLATLLLVVLKLFVVDLAELDPLWRVAVFLGIGAGFLVVGYYLPQVWRPIAKPESGEGE